MNQMLHKGLETGHGDSYARPEEINAFGFDELFGILEKHKWLIIISALLFSCLAGMFNYIVQKDTYSTTASIVLLNNSDQIVPGGNNQTPLNRELVESEVAVIKSEAIASLVVEEFELDKNPAWNGTAPELASLSDEGLELTTDTELALSEAGTQLTDAGMPLPAPELAVSDENLPNDLPEVTTDQSLLPDEAAISGDDEEGFPEAEGEGRSKEFSYAVRRLMQATNATTYDRSYAIGISVTASDPETSAKLTNGVAKAYLRWHKDSTSENAHEASVWLDERLETLRDQIRSKEQEIATYRANNGVIAAIGSTLNEQQMRDAQNAYNISKREFDEASFRWQQARQLAESPDGVLTIDAAAGSPLLTTLRADQFKLDQELADLKTRYGALHPEVKEKEAEIERIELSIGMETQRLLTNMANRLYVTRERMQQDKQELDQLQADMRESNTVVVTLERLEREAEALRKQYNTYNDQFQQANDRTSMSAARARLLSSAPLPENSDKQPLALFVVFGLVLGTVIGLGIVCVFEVMDNKLHGASDVKLKLSRRALSSIPALRQSVMRSVPQDKQTPTSYVVEKPMSAFAESLRVLLNSSVARVSADSGKVVSITSALPAEGKTTISLSLARVAALANIRVLIIDCDYRRCSLSETIGQEFEHDLNDVLSSKVDWRKVVIRDTATSADILPSALDAEGEPNMIDPSALYQLLNELRTAYQLIILDAPPILAVADAITVAELADNNLLVARAGMTSAKTINSAISRIEVARGERVSGVVLNFVNPKNIGRLSYDDALYFNQSKRNYYIN